MVSDIRVSDELKRKAASEGIECLNWLAEIPRLVEEMATLWSLRIGEPLAGGTASFVVAATTTDCSDAVLKLAMPAKIDGWETLDREARVLDQADGRGCVRSLAYDPSRHALLLERLRAPLADSGLPLSRQLEIICRLLSELWTTTPDTGLPTGYARAVWLGSFIAEAWEQLGPPVSRRVMDYAQQVAHRRATEHSDYRSVLVHGDAHAWNALRSRTAAGEFRLIDPDGLYAERECDLAISMREYLGDLLQGDPLDIGARRAKRLAELTGTDARRIWEWGYLELVGNGLLLIKTGKNEAAGRTSLEIAEMWAHGNL